MIKAAIINPETLLAPSNVLNAAPIALNKAVIHIAVAKTMIQKVKKKMWAAMKRRLPKNLAMLSPTLSTRDRLRNSACST